MKTVEENFRKTLTELQNLRYDYESLRRKHGQVLGIKHKLKQENKSYRTWIKKLQRENDAYKKTIEVYHTLSKYLAYNTIIEHLNGYAYRDLNHLKSEMERLSNAWFSSTNIQKLNIFKLFYEEEQNVEK